MNHHFNAKWMYFSRNSGSTFLNDSKKVKFWPTCDKLEKNWPKNPIWKFDGNNTPLSKQLKIHCCHFSVSALCLLTSDQAIFESVDY